MGKAQRPGPVKLIAGCIYGDERLLRQARTSLVRLYGPVDLESDAFRFDQTDYYLPEFGESLSKKIFSFSRLIQPRSLPDIKLRTNALEQRLSAGGKRRVNIDPGYVTLAKLVLATTKDFSHRVYLSKGIFAEVTLVFKDKTFRPWPWTYPDYRCDEYALFFNRVRAIYARQISD